MMAREFLLRRQRDQDDTERNAAQRPQAGELDELLGLPDNVVDFVAIRNARRGGLRLATPTHDGGSTAA